MVVASGTRLTARRWRLVPFLRASMAAARQAEQTPGFVGGMLLKDMGRTYWTITLWRDREAMNAYRNEGHHDQVMARIKVLAEGFRQLHMGTGGRTSTQLARDVHERLRMDGKIMTFDGRAERPLHGPIRTGLTIRLRPKT